MLLKSNWPAEKRAKKNAVRVARERAYAEVDVRDRSRCRCCQRVVFTPGTGPMDQWLEHHHIKGRGKLWLEVASNIITLCKKCHDWRHKLRTLRMAGDANVLGSVRFWTKEREWYG